MRISSRQAIHQGKKMRKKEFIISVITPVYNAEDYLEETIECVIGQTIGLKENVQMILVNDGSPDESFKICEKYKELYPDNIEYIEKENGGVSSARNEGLAHVKGKYTVFLDADDIWSSNSFKRIYDFFEDHYEEIDVCSCRMRYIGDFATRDHPLDYKYDKGKRVVDLENESNIFCTTIGNSAFKSDVLKGRSFDQNLRYCEDSLFQNMIIIEKMKIGIISDAVFFYRKNIAGENASLNITRSKDWYFGVITDYYLRLLKYTKEKKGRIPRMVQELVFYDLKWRGYNEHAVGILSDDEKDKHLELLEETLKLIDDEVIISAPKVSYYKKVYFLNLKYKRNLFEESIIEKNSLIYEGKRIFGFRAKSTFIIKIIEIHEEIMHVYGVARLDFIDSDYQLYAKDDTGEVYLAKTEEYEQADIRGVLGETVSKADMFYIEIPVRNKKKISFFAKVNNKEIRLRPHFDTITGMTRSVKNSYTVEDKYILKFIGDRICIYNYNAKTHIASELRFCRDIVVHDGAKKGLGNVKLRLEKLLQNRKRLKNRVAFISVRSNDALQGNMAIVYDALKLPKIKYAKLLLHKYPDYVREARKIIKTSKIVVTDDYLLELKDKKRGQYFIQLWHSTGAGKHFGQDGTTLFPPRDALHHRNYDLVTVSSEHVRKVFQSAFNIPIETISATGVARTDLFFDEKYKKETMASVFEQYPELAGKKVILYAPTFRDLPGVSREIFMPELDFERLSKSLKNEQIFVLRPHPVMTKKIVSGNYKNILEIRDVSTNDLMFVSDLLISDYSSTLFEYSLLKKPMAFYCYDYDDYDRDFYFDFDNELPGPILKTEDELIDYLSQDSFPTMDNYDEFYEKYMGACDGHSTERIVREIEKLFKK